MSIDGIDLAIFIRRAARSRNRSDQSFQRDVGIDDSIAHSARIVLHFFQSDQVGRFEVVDDELRQRVELGRAVAWVEVFDIESRNRNRLLGQVFHHFALQSAGDDKRRLRDEQFEVAKAVIEYANRWHHAVADIDDGRGRNRVIQNDAFGVEVVRANHDAARRCAHTRAKTLVADNRNLAKIAGRANSNREVDLHAHRFQTFVKVDAVLRGIERATGFHAAHHIVFDGLRGRRAAFRADNRRGRQRQVAHQDSSTRCADLRGGEVVSRASTRTKLAHASADRNQIADVRQWSRTGKDENRFRCGVVAVAVGVLQVVAVGTFGGHDSADT